MRDLFIKSLKNLTKKDPNIILITGDLGFGVLDDFKSSFPNNYINAGVAEQNMTGIAAGLALEGKRVFTYSIGNFPILRCLEQIRNDVCYHNANVNIVSIGYCVTSIVAPPKEVSIFTPAIFGTYTTAPGITIVPSAREKLPNISS